MSKSDFWPIPGDRLIDIATPMPVIDEDRLAANIGRVQAYMDQHGRRFRPHIKTHKNASIAWQQLEAGAVGINCQKLSEAEIFANAGFEDILLTYNVLGAAKLQRLKLLNARIPKLSVTVDNVTALSGLAATFQPARPLNVLVECDTGGGRCGVQTPAAAHALATIVAASPGLSFGGILTYPGIGRATDVESFMAMTLRLLAQDDIACPVVSSGGTPDLFQAHLVPSATEHRAGTYVFNDRSTERCGHCSSDDFALHVLATVVSRPTAGRAVLDAGSKTLTSDLFGFEDHGTIVGFEGARIVSLSEEHAVVDLQHCPMEFAEVGAVVKIVPNHACVIANLFDRLVFHRDGIVTRVDTVDARGAVW